MRHSSALLRQASKSPETWQPYVKPVAQQGMKDVPSQNDLPKNNILRDLLYSICYGGNKLTALV